MLENSRNVLFCVIGVFLALVVSFGPLISQADACSDVGIGNKEDIVISARTMDFEIDLASQFQIVPRGQKMVSSAPDGQEGVSWTSKYGFVAINALDMDKYSDGLNEKGLSAAILWLEETEYSTPVEADSVLSVLDTTAWILGNFATVEEVQAGLQEVTIWGEWSEKIQRVPPIHLSIHDAQGNDLVVEFMDGQMNIYENQYGVLTNSPAFDWQSTNLDYYLAENKIELTPGNPQTSTDPGIAILGLPSIQDPPQRFMLLSILRSYLPEPQTTQEAIGFAFHMIDRVTLVPGEDRITAPSVAPMPYGGDYTQWTVVRDHVNLVYYYKTMLNTSVRAIYLKEIDFSEGKPVRSIVMEDDGVVWYQDMTSQFK
jgi:choloylglycine hydrolase